MIIHDFHIMRVAVSPTKTESPAIVDTDAVLTGSIAFQSLQSISWRCSQVTQFGRGIQLSQFALCNALELSKAQYTLPSMQPLRVRRTEGLDHNSYSIPLYVKCNTFNT